MKALREITVFVAHSFEPKCNSYTKAEFRQAIQAVFDNVSKELALDSAGFRIKVVFEFSDFQETISEQLHHLLDGTDFGIVELSDNNQNVMYELGYMTAKNIPHVILKSKNSKIKGFALPVDISPRLYCEYEKVGEIVSILKDNIAFNINSIIRNRRLENRLFYDVWFPANTQIINLICAQEYEIVSSQKLTSPYYTHLDNLCDKDALLETMVFLSRKYAEARLVKYSDLEFSVRQNLKDNLVVIGGPGSSFVQGGNQITRLVNEKIKSRVSYSEDCEVLRVAKNNKMIEFKAEISKKGTITKDYGYFARFPNPFNPARNVILLHGIHTNGVLGAAQAFSDRVTARLNYQVLEDVFANDSGELAFECIFEVDVFEGDVVTPKVKNGDVWPLDIL